MYGTNSDSRAWSSSSSLVPEVVLVPLMTLELVHGRFIDEFYGFAREKHEVSDVLSVVVRWCVEVPRSDSLCPFVEEDDDRDNSLRSGHLPCPASYVEAPSTYARQTTMRVKNIEQARHCFE